MAEPPVATAAEFREIQVLIEEAQKIYLSPGNLEYLIEWLDGVNKDRPEAGWLISILSTWRKKEKGNT